jgi:hypothetical protein
MPSLLLFWVHFVLFFDFIFPSLSRPFFPEKNLTLFGDAYFRNNVIGLTPKNSAASLLLLLLLLHLLLLLLRLEELSISTQFVFLILPTPPLLSCAVSPSPSFFPLSVR